MEILNEDETKILMWFGNFPPESRFRVNHVATCLSMTQRNAFFYMDRLVTKGHLKRIKLSRRNFLYSLNV